MPIKAAMGDFYEATFTFPPTIFTDSKNKMNQVLGADWGDAQFLSGPMVF